MASLVAVLFGLSLQTGGANASTPAAAHVAQDPAPNGDTGTTIDPLQYNCGNDAPTCGQVGESNGYYNGTNVDLLYSEDYYCDTNVTSNASTGCEAGAPQSGSPSANSANGTIARKHDPQDTLYIPVPLFSNPPPTQCTATATCIDHPPTIDLSRHRRRPPGQPEIRAALNTSPSRRTTTWSAPATAVCPSGGTSRWSPPPTPPRSPR